MGASHPLVLIGGAMQGPEKCHMRGYRAKPDQDLVSHGGSRPPAANGAWVKEAQPAQRTWIGVGVQRNGHKRHICASLGPHGGVENFPPLTFPLSLEW